MTTLFEIAPAAALRQGKINRQQGLDIAQKLEDVRARGGKFSQLSGTLHKELGIPFEPNPVAAPAVSGPPAPPPAGFGRPSRRRRPTTLLGGDSEPLG